MNSMEQAVPAPGRQPAQRPSVWRKVGSAYLDLLISCFLGWVLATAFTAKDTWSTLSLGLFLVQSVLCRGTLRPTLGDFFMGIRYLSSSSKQVVADIRVVNPKVKVNGFLLAAGAVELTLTVMALSLWTLMDQAVFLGKAHGLPDAFLYDTVLGLLFFLCSALMLSASKNAAWAVPIVHGCVLLEFYVSVQAWSELLPSVKVQLPWWEQAAKVSALVPDIFLVVFLVWSLVLAGGLWFSRRLLVH